MQLSENLSQELAQWYRNEQVQNRGLDAPELWATVVSPQQRAVRQEMIDRWREEYVSSIYAEVSELMRTPSLEGIDVPTIATEADVRAACRPDGLASVQGGSPTGDPGAAKNIIEAGRTELGGEKAVAEAMRAGRIQARSDLGQEVNQDHDRGFFSDPNLRNQTARPSSRDRPPAQASTSEDDTSELPALLRHSYAVFCLTLSSRPPRPGRRDRRTAPHEHRLSPLLHSPN